MGQEFQLATEQAQAILHMIGMAVPVQITPVKQHNHVYRLTAGDEAFFLKTYTKDWYGDDVPRTGGCVEHEVAAWDLLATHGLRVPEVALACEDCDNPLGRPFLLTKQLPGQPLTDLLVQHPEHFQPLLYTTGEYLRRCHAITFAFPGYIMRDGPTAPPVEDAWQHGIWTARQRQKDGFAMLHREQHQLSPVLVQQLASRFAEIEAVLTAAYHPPRFVHGDCHAHQFFLLDEAGGWQVTGFVDMEVASAGDCVADLIKISIEMADRFLPTTRWWEHLFAGYGAQPDFEHFRLRLLTSSNEEFGGTGAWRGTREENLTHIMAAQDWAALFT